MLVGCQQARRDHLGRQSRGASVGLRDADIAQAAPLGQLARLRDMEWVDVQAEHLAVAANPLSEELERSPRAAAKIERPPTTLHRGSVEQRHGVLVQFVGLTVQPITFGRVATECVHRRSAAVGVSAVAGVLTVVQGRIGCRIEHCRLPSGRRGHRVLSLAQRSPEPTRYRGAPRSAIDRRATPALQRPGRARPRCSAGCRRFPSLRL